MVDLVSCADLGIEVSGKFFDGHFVIFVFSGVFKCGRRACFCVATITFSNLASHLVHLEPTLLSSCTWKAGKVGSETETAF